MEQNPLSQTQQNQAQLSPVCSGIAKTVFLPSIQNILDRGCQDVRESISKAGCIVPGDKCLTLPSELAVLRESTFKPITIVDQEIVNLWRSVASSKGLDADADIAKFLLTNLHTGRAENTLYCSHCHNPLSLTCIHCSEHLTLQKNPSESLSSKFQEVRILPPDVCRPKLEEDESLPSFVEEDAVQVAVRDVKDHSVSEDIAFQQETMRASQRGRKRKAACKVSTRCKVFSATSQGSEKHSASPDRKRALVKTENRTSVSDTEAGSTKRYRVAGRSYKSKVTLKDLIDLSELFANQNTQLRQAKQASCDSEGDFSKENGKPKVYFPRKSFTLQAFLSGKIQLQVPDKNNIDGWVYSHYLCEECWRIFVTKEEFNQHQNDVHLFKQESEDPKWTGEMEKSSESQTKCVINLDEKSLEILMQLKDQHLFCCPHCDLAFNHRRLYSTHVRKHNYKVEKGNFTCLLCSSTFKKLSNLELHMRIPETEDDKCVECGFCFSSWCQVHPHRKVHKKEKMMSSKARSLCSLCGKNVHPHALKDHIARHTTTHRYFCVECPMTFKVEKDLRAHKLTHGDKKFQCENCGLKFFLAKSLKKHVLNKHSNIDVGFKCSLCDKKIQTAKGLQIHIAEVHNKIKPYNCSFCPMMFARRSEVPIHERIHTGDRPFKCEQCPAAFTRMTYLNKHLQAHKGHQRPRHDCEDCNKSFSCLSRYRKHCQKQHGNRSPEILSKVASQEELSTVRLDLGYSDGW